MLTLPLLAIVLACTVGMDPPPSITRPSPDVVMCGATSVVTIRSTDAKRRFDSTCRVVFANPDGALARIRSNHGDRLTIAVSLPAHTDQRPRDLRVVSDFGISNTVPLFVTDRPVHLEKEPNNTSSEASLLTLNTVVSGIIHAATEQDRWRFSVREGQDIEFQLSTKSLDSALDPIMTLIDPNGRNVAWSSTTPGDRASLSHRCASYGSYHLIVHDVRFRGGSNYRYHLRVGAPVADSGTSFPAEGSTPESEPNEQIKSLKPYLPPFTISARIAEPSDVDLFCFEVKTSQTLVLTANGKLFGSPIDPLLELCDAGGQRLKIDDDSGPGNAARIQYGFRPGRYIAVVRSLVQNGGDRHKYLLEVAKPTRPAPEFELRFQPDSVRVGRGSHAKLWCEVVRRGGYKGLVNLRCPNPPPGISITPIELGPKNRWTSVFTVDASAGARLGTQRLLLSATGKLGTEDTEHVAIAENGASTSSSAWVTVLDQPPFLVAPLGQTGPKTQQRWKDRRTSLVKRLSTSSPKIAKELVTFRKEHGAGRHWIALTPTKMISRRRAPFSTLEDGSVLAGGNAPGDDTYDIEFDCPLENITAIRLDALPHASLPAGGPGRQPTSGNFVLNRLLLAAAPRSDKEAMTKIALLRSAARLAQKNYGAKFAIDNSIKTGWAMHPYAGQANWLIAELKTPVQNPGGSYLRLTLDQLHGSQHLLGRFRISVAGERLAGNSHVVPPKVHTALGSGKDPKLVTKWFRSVSPSLEIIRSQIAAIDTGQGNQRAIEQMEKQLRTETPELLAARHAWEDGIRAGLVQWTPLSITEMRSKSGVRFEKEANHVVRVRRAVTDTDDYQLLATTELRDITAIRLEALPDKTLPGKGPGLAQNGNFVLSGFQLASAAASKPSAFSPVPLHSPEASFQQAGFNIVATLDGNPRTGWAVAGNTGKSSVGVWKTRKPLHAEGGVVLKFDLRHRSVHVRHQLGRVRLSVTNTPDPSLAKPGLPSKLIEALNTARAARNPAQRQVVIERFRRTAPQLQSMRARIDLLRAEQVAYPPQVQRGKIGSVAVRITRREDFEGPITLMLEGFSSGRAKNGKPRPITPNLAVDAVTLKAGQSVGVLKIRATKKCELGNRAVVVRASGTLGGRKVTEYSAPILVTVTK
ncbi:MAG: hypothetical protein VX951_09935 [Planctomycetota bacterium]|nr:hypothetical protein [Planctomycetota bacterium]